MSRHGKLCLKEDLEMKLYKGAQGEVVEVILPTDKELEITINGEPAKLLKASSTDAALEKHVPDVTVADGKVAVQVGSVKHPMIETHWITNIWMEYPDGSVEKVTLLPGQDPVAEFSTKGMSGKAAVYEYCNLHGLWKKEIDL